MDSRVIMGVSIGSSSTDICVIDYLGRVAVEKVPTTEADPVRGALAAAGRLLQRQGYGWPQVAYVSHSTVVVGDALHEGDGAPVGLITTRGFRDVLELGRQTRSDPYDLQLPMPESLVPRSLRVEVGERVLAGGRVSQPLNSDEVRTAVRYLSAQGVGSFAVGLLHSYAYPAHERQVGTIIAEQYPGALVFLSHAVVPEFREFERFTMTVLSARGAPVLQAYADRLLGELRRLGMRGQVFLARSSGGVAPLAEAVESPVATINAGASVGAVAVGELCAQLGLRNLISFEMGGTRTEISLITDGAPQLTAEREIGGYRLRLPAVDLHSLAVGGNSLVWVDAGHKLQVGSRIRRSGPRQPGQPTVSDALTALGVVAPGLLGGVDACSPAAGTGLEQVGAALGLDALTASRAVVSKVVSSAARLIRLAAIHRELDPRDFTLVAHGGCGPLHAALLARELGIRQVVIPRFAGSLAAYGLLFSDLRADFAQTWPLDGEQLEPAAVDQAFRPLEERGWLWLRHHARHASQLAVRRYVDMCYEGQHNELTVPVPDGVITLATLATVRQRFHALHEQRRGFSLEGAPVRVVTFRVEARGAVPEIRRPPDYLTSTGVSDPVSALTGERAVHISGSRESWPVFDRTRLGPGHVLSGPALLERGDSTVLVLPGQQVQVDPFHNLVLNELAQGR